MKIQYESYRGHCAACEDDRPRGLDDLFEVRRGIQVLVLDLNLIVDHAEGDAAV